MVSLSVNVNKFATLRNARGGNSPDLLSVVSDVEDFGAQGITIHPRPDERHIRYADARDLGKLVRTELNMEGNPIDRFVQLVLEVRPKQVTLVPDAEDAITSNAGWDTIANSGMLSEVIKTFRENGIRTSLFVDPVPAMVEGAAKTGTDRIELYTEAYAIGFAQGNLKAVASYAEAARVAADCGLGLNAGHDLNLDNVGYLKDNLPGLLEVSIGHALVCEAIYLGLENVIQMYLHRLR